MEKQMYNPNKEIHFPKSIQFLTTESKTKAEWLKLIPTPLHLKFEEWFDKTK